jgi:hypothetical protein
VDDGDTRDAQHNTCCCATPSVGRLSAGERVQKKQLILWSMLGGPVVAKQPAHEGTATSCAEAEAEEAEEERWAIDPAAELTEYLFLGSALASENKHCLQQRGITKILNVADDIECHYPHDFEYKHLRIEDGGEDSSIIGPLLDDAIAFAAQAKASKAKLLLHCYMGVNRSATVAIALLIALENMTLKEANEHVERRREINVRTGNKQKLAQWEQRRTGACTLSAWKSA